MKTDPYNTIIFIHFQLNNLDTIHSQINQTKSSIAKLIFISININLGQQQKLIIASIKLIIVIIYIMADLNRLFVGRPNPGPSQRANQSYSLYQENARSQTRNLFGYFTRTQDRPQNVVQKLRLSATLNTPLRRTQKELAKTTVQNQNMLQEIQYFKKLSNQQFLKKSLTVLIPLILFGILGLVNRKICFEMIQVGVSIFLLQRAFIQNKTIKLFLKTLPALTYLALFYDILTEGKHAGQYYIMLANLPALLVAISATVNFTLIRKFQFISEENLRNVQINLKLKQQLKYFFKKYISRIRSIIRLIKQILALQLSLALIFTLYCLFTSNNLLYSETILTVPSAIVIYFLIDIFIYTVQFLSRQVSLFDLKRKFYQVHVCMSLLRLKPSAKLSQQNFQIQLRCLQQVSKQLKYNSEYLDTPVKVNYAINTYRDIFQIYTSTELSQLISQVNQLVLRVLRNNKLSKSTKTLQKDLFIHFRRLFAKLQNDWLVTRILAQIQKRKLVFLIMVKLAHESPLRTQIIESVFDVRQAVKKIYNYQGIFIIGQDKLKDWMNQMEQLHKSMKNQQIGININTISKVDQNGWAHYQTKNILQQNL